MPTRPDVAAIAAHPDGLSPTSEADRPLRRDAIENRRRVLAAAAEVFAVRGLDASVEEIANAAGVGMGTLYRRFPNKEALIDQLVSDLFASVLDAGRRAMQSTDGEGLEAFVRQTVSLQEAHRGCISRLWETPVPKAFLAEFDGIVEELLARAKAAGRIRGDCTSTDVAVLLWAARGIIEATGRAAPVAWKRHLDITLAGLRPDAAALDHTPLTSGQRAAVRLQTESARRRSPP